MDPEEPSEEEKPKDPPKDKEDDKRALCKQLENDLENASLKWRDARNAVEAANDAYVQKDKELTALIVRRSGSIASTVGSGIVGASTGGPLGAARGVVVKGLDFLYKEAEIQEKPKKWRKPFEYCSTIASF